MLEDSTFQFVVKLIEVAVAISVPVLIACMGAMIRVLWELNNRVTSLEKTSVSVERITKLENTTVTHEQARADRHAFHEALDRLKAELKSDLSADFSRLEAAVRDLWQELKEHRHK